MVVCCEPLLCNCCHSCRLSDQAQRQLQDSEKFEDILLGNSRPTVVVQRYQELYSQGRVEALEAIASALGREEEEEEEELSPTSFSAKLLLDVLKVTPPL